MQNTSINVYDRRLGHVNLRLIVLGLIVWGIAMVEIDCRQSRLTHSTKGRDLER